MASTTIATPRMAEGAPYKRAQADAWLDAENLLRGLQRYNRAANLWAFGKAIHTALGAFVQVEQVYAYGDFHILARIFRCNVERELRGMNIRTVHLTNRQGKNTADMEIACAIVQRISAARPPQSIVIGAGDRDFCPVVKTAHRQGVQVVVLTFANSISRDLATVADRVVFLEPHLPV